MDQEQVIAQCGRFAVRTIEAMKKAGLIAPVPSSEARQKEVAIALLGDLVRIDDASTLGTIELHAFEEEANVIARRLAGAAGTAPEHLRINNWGWGRDSTEKVGMFVRAQEPIVARIMSMECFGVPDIPGKARFITPTGRATRLLRPRRALDEVHAQFAEFLRAMAMYGALQRQLEEAKAFLGNQSPENLEALRTGIPLAVEACAGSRFGATATKYIEWLSEQFDDDGNL